MGLSDQDRDALIDAVLDDAARKDGFMVLGPGGTDGNTPTLTEAVEQIVARHVAAALTEAAKAIEAKRNEHWQQHLREHPFADGTSCPRDYGQHDAFALSARIVRDRIPPP